MTDLATLAGTRLCPVDAVSDGKAREIFVGSTEDPFHVVLFGIDGRAVAYRNRCPHFMLPLNAGPGRFILLDDGLVMCAWHSAVFRIADGKGIDGPCMGASLDPLPIHEQDGHWVLG